MNISNIFKRFNFKEEFARFRKRSSAIGLAMVRYFPNTLKDYTEGAEVSIAQNDVSVQIDEHIGTILKRLPPSPKHVEGGLYVGIAGVAYMFYHLSKNEKLAEKKASYRERALEYLNVALKNPTMDKTSFLLGDAGTYALASVIKHSVEDKSYNDMLTNYRQFYNTLLNPNFLKCGGDEFFVGRSGYLAGALWIASEMKTLVLSSEEMHNICKVIVDSGREYAKKHRSPCPLMYHYYGTEYLGAAHGISFILQMLLSVPGFLESDAAAAKDIKGTIDYLLSIQSKDGNWPTCMEELEQKEHKLVHWCHGAPGVVYLMAKAYLVYENQQYLNACIRAGENVWAKGLLMKGPGICHGVAGNGYVFLLLYRLTNDVKFLHRAKAFAEFMNSDQFLSDARVPDNPETLYEGTAGTVCFLADLLTPEKASFPFQDVFAAYNL
ncbi:lanC-like protein 3 homolog [Leguminivora glycinivorella]|uniref:lanC-like protein 3 homolog n=1 Tax=Leguminivora glycinivorella TaxID=1035111 RepID=UPI00200F46E4|nr:lanC-like protein 3 homolog [Leguminivora glycinivorella]